MLWATELRLGRLEACDIELREPTAWASLVERIIGSLETGRGAEADVGIGAIARRRSILTVC